MIGMGCMRLSTERDRDEDRAIAVLHAAFDRGVTFLDTADAYCWHDGEIGHNERLIARAIATWGGEGSRIRVATKGGLTRPSGAWASSSSSSIGSTRRSASTSAPVGRIPASRGGWVFGTETRTSSSQPDARWPDFGCASRRSPSRSSPAEVLVSVSQQYTRELRDELGYLPTWLPITHVSPGGVGRIVDYQYTHVGTLADFGITYEIEDGDARADFEYQSAGSVSAAVKLAGEAPAAGSTLATADAGIALDFSKEHAIVFRATGCRSTRIKNQLALGAAVLAKYQTGAWPDDLVVVTEAVSAASATIVISSGDKAHLDLRASGKADAAGLHLANAEAKLQIARESNIGTKIIAEAKLTPLMRTSGVRKRILRDAVFRSERAVPTGTGEELAFDDVEYEDYGG
jgi:hypothetical protein